MRFTGHGFGMIPKDESFGNEVRNGYLAVMLITKPVALPHAWDLRSNFDVMGHMWDI